MAGDNFFARAFYNGGMRYFDRAFFKFLVGFLVLISVSLGVLAYAKSL